jgi:ketosteroid isomerase-like protein
MFQDRQAGKGRGGQRGARIRGKQAIADWFHAWEEAFPYRRLEAKSVCVNGFYLPGQTSVTVEEWTCTETDREGREYAFDGVSVIQSRNWKTVRVSEYIFFAGLPQLSTLLQSAIKAQDTVAAH